MGAHASIRTRGVCVIASIPPIIIVCIYIYMLIHCVGVCSSKLLCTILCVTLSSCVCVSVRVLRVHISFTDQFIKFE